MGIIEKPTSGIGCSFTEAFNFLQNIPGSNNSPEYINIMNQQNQNI